jgi:hypothetical protein
MLRVKTIKAPLRWAMLASPMATGAIGQRPGLVPQEPKQPGHLRPDRAPVRISAGAPRATFPAFGFGHQLTECRSRGVGGRVARHIVRALPAGLPIRIKSPVMATTTTSLVRESIGLPKRLSRVSPNVTAKRWPKTPLPPDRWRGRADPGRHSRPTWYAAVLAGQSHRRLAVVMRVCPG